MRITLWHFLVLAASFGARRPTTYRSRLSNGDHLEVVAIAYCPQLSINLTLILTHAIRCLGQDGLQRIVRNPLVSLAFVDGILKHFGKTRRIRVKEMSCIARQKQEQTNWVRCAILGMRNRYTCRTCSRTNERKWVQIVTVQKIVSPSHCEYSFELSGNEQTKERKEMWTPVPNW